jgi:hypothetical protein
VDVRRILHGDGVTERLDKNHNGIYDLEELSELAKANVDGLKGFEYFTRPTLDGTEVKLGHARLLARAQEQYFLAHLDAATRAAGSGTA